MKRHPYIVATILATILAIVVWACMPKEYAATTKVSDEYKETDLAVGLDDLTVKLKKSLGSENDGINDIEVYCQALKTTDFAQYISNCQIPGRHMSYGQWVMLRHHFWQSKDTLEIISDNIEYNINTKQQTLTIQFTDRDPVIASKMLGHCVKHLQNIVNVSRQKFAQAKLQDAEKYLTEANAALERTQRKYSSFSDSHTDVTSEVFKQEESQLEKEVDISEKQVEDAQEKYIRQKYLAERSIYPFAVIKPNVVPEKDTSHLWVYIFVFVLFALTGVKGWHLYKQRKAEHVSIDFGGLFSPWSITIVVWSVILCSLYIYSEKFDAISNNFYVCIVSWTSVFCASSFITYNLGEHKCVLTDISKTATINTTLFNILFYISLLCTPLLIYQVYKMLSMFEPKDLVYNVRLLSVKGDGFGKLNIVYTIDIVLLLISLWKFTVLPKWKSITIIILWLGYALCSMAKGYFFMLFVFVIYVMYSKKVIKVRSIILSGIILLLVFYVFNLSRTEEDSSYQQNETLLDFIFMYILSGSVAFGRIMKNISDTFGENVLYIFYYYGDKLFGTGVPEHQQYQDFVYVPVLTNVFTILRPYYADFGIIGMSIVAYIYGIISGYIYRLSQNGSFFAICVYTYIVYVLSMQFFDDVIVEGTGILIQSFLLLYCVTNLKLNFNRNKSEKSKIE